MTLELVKSLKVCKSFPRLDRAHFELAIEGFQDFGMKLDTEMSEIQVWESIITFPIHRHFIQSHTVK